MLEDLKPLIVVLVFTTKSLLDFKSTVSNLEHEGHDICSKEEEKSIKQPLQKVCSHEVTWNNNEMELEENQ